MAIDCAPLLKHLDKSGEAFIERWQQDRMLTLIRAKKEAGCELRDLYRQIHIKLGRNIAQDLVRAGFVTEVHRAEAYAAVEHLTN